MPRVSGQNLQGCRFRRSTGHLGPPISRGLPFRARTRTGNNPFLVFWPQGIGPPYPPCPCPRSPSAPRVRLSRRLPTVMRAAERHEVALVERVAAVPDRQLVIDVRRLQRALRAQASRLGESLDPGTPPRSAAVDRLDRGPVGPARLVLTGGGPAVSLATGRPAAGHERATLRHDARLSCSRRHSQTQTRTEPQTRTKKKRGKYPFLRWRPTPASPPTPTPSPLPLGGRTGPMTRSGPSRSTVKQRPPPPPRRCLRPRRTADPIGVRRCARSTPAH